MTYGAKSIPVSGNDIDRIWAFGLRGVLRPPIAAICGTGASAG